MECAAPTVVDSQGVPRRKATRLDFESSNFGRITATRDMPNDPRIIHFGLKFYR